MIWQSEFSPNNILHYQGYVEFTTPYGQQTVKSLFSDRQMHVEPSKESRTANIIYCSKITGFAGTRYCKDETGIHTQDSNLDILDDVFNLEAKPKKTQISTPLSPFN